MIQLPADGSAGALFDRRMPTGAVDFNAGPNSIGDELVMQPGPAEYYPGKVGCPDRPHLHHLTALCRTLRILSTSRVPARYSS